MDHEHQLHDAGDVFEIDPFTRAIEYKGQNELLLMQYDHNSEMYTFRLPKEIDGHDMTKCNKIEIHFINVGETDKKDGIYEATGISIDPTDNKYATFTWLVSQGATSISGILTFMIRFRCIEGDVITYSWGTDMFSGIKVGAGFDNSQEFIEQYYDILETWRTSIVNSHEWQGTTLVITSASGTSSADLKGDTGKSAYEIAKEKGFDGTEEEWLDFIAGFTKTILTTAGDSIRFFVGTQKDYDTLNEAEKAGVFALITDETGDIETAIYDIMRNVEQHDDILATYNTTTIPKINAAISKLEHDIVWLDETTTNNINELQSWKTGISNGSIGIALANKAKTLENLYHHVVIIERDLVNVDDLSTIEGKLTIKIEYVSTSNLPETAKFDRQSCAVGKHYYNGWVYKELDSLQLDDYHDILDYEITAVNMNNKYTYVTINRKDAISLSCAFRNNTATVKTETTQIY